MENNRKITKRDFLKYSFMGTCGLALGVAGIRSFGNSVFSKAPGIPSLSPAPSGEKLWKWSKEAYFYIETPKGIKCKLCPQKCELKNGETGDCRTNVNFDGKLFTISYGNPCAVHVDPVEKKPLFHYLPNSTAYSIATAGCNLACLNCQNWDISQSSPKDTRNLDLMPEYVVKEAKNNNCKSIAYTYSDPVAFYEYTFDTAKIAREQGIKNILISAGYINEVPLRQLCKYLDAANIDMKSFSDETYEMLNAGTLEPVLNTLKILKEEGVWLEIGTLVVPTWSDDLDMIKQMCEWIVKNELHTYPFHFLRFQPLYKLTNLPQTPVSTLEKARQIALDAGMKYVYIGNVPGHEAENTYCPKCKKLLIERKGFTVTQNNIVNSSCKFCQEKIHGVWN